MLAYRPIDTSKANRAFQALARYSGKSLEAVVLSEAGSILDKALKLTKTASVSDITGDAGTGKAFTTDIGNGRKTYWLENRYSDAIWSKIEQQKKAALRRKLRARGLSKQSWHLLGMRIGLEIVAPSYVKRAVATTARSYPENATARKTNTRDKVGIYLSNKQPTVSQIGGRIALLKAINGRVGYFRRQLKAGTFNDLAKIAKAYPGLKINPAAAARA